MHLKALIVFAFLSVLNSLAFALIVSEKGNETFPYFKLLQLPNQTRTLFEIPSRIGYWEGPPFGGGLYVFEFQTKDIESLNLRVQEFSEISTSGSKLIIKDGPTASRFFDNEDGTTIPVNYIIEVWNPARYKELHKTEAGAEAATGNPVNSPVPSPTMTIYVTDKLPYERIVMYKNLELEDQRKKR